MKRVARVFWPLAFAVYLAAAPAGALPVTVFWDGPTLQNEQGEDEPGHGVTAATAAAANAAGVPTVQTAGFQLVSGLDENSIGRALDRSTLVTVGDPITSLTITSTWTVHNDTGAGLPNLYLVFQRPLENGDVVYDPSDVGLTLGNNWVVLQTVAGGIPLYYPAVSLGNLANGANATFPLLYTLHNPPQEFSRINFNLELGMPKWSLFFVTVPEPTSGLLVLFGLLGISRGRRKRS